MATSLQVVHKSNHKKALRPFSDPSEILRLHGAFVRAVRAVGRRMEQVERGAWEGRSLSGSHTWSRNDLESNSLLIRFVEDFLAREGLNIALSFESEEMSLVPESCGEGFALRGVIDPVDGTKAFDNWACGGPFPLPRPSSAISIAVVCPVLGETILSVVYCFDLGEVFSSVYVGRDREGKPRYCSFRDDSLIPPFSSDLASHQIEAKQRVLNSEYNSRSLEEIAHLSLALMDRGLKASYGGLTGSSATDIINVVRGSFAAYVDMRALCRRGGSILYFYDVAGALPIALGRGLCVILVDGTGAPLVGAGHPIYTPVGLVVARPDVALPVVDAIRAVVCSAFPAAPVLASVS